MDARTAHPLDRSAPRSRRRRTWSRRRARRRARGRLALGELLRRRRRLRPPPTTTTAAPATNVDLDARRRRRPTARVRRVTIAADQSQQRARRAQHLRRRARPCNRCARRKPATADFGAVFDATTLASATTTDRGVLLDEGLPKVTGDLDRDRASRSRSSASATRPATSRWSPRARHVDVDRRRPRLKDARCNRAATPTSCSRPTRRHVEDHRVPTWS